MSHAGGHRGAGRAGPGRWVWGLCVCAGLVLALVQPAGVGAPQAVGRRGEGASLPASLEAALVVHDAASARRSPQGRAAWEGIARAGLLGPRTVEAWERLAEALDVSGEEAFDALLGRSFTLLVRGMGGPGPSQWAMVCRVDEATRQRVVRSLRPAARGVREGVVLLTIEGGRFEVAVTERDGGSTLVLAPSESGGLVDDLTGLAQGGVVLPAAAGAGPSLRWLWRDPDDPGRWLDARATPASDGWDIDFAGAALPGPGAGEGPGVGPEAWSAWQQIDAGRADLCVLGRTPGLWSAMPASVRALGRTALDWLGVPAELRSMGLRVGLRVSRGDGAQTPASVSVLLGSDDAGLTGLVDRWLRAALTPAGGRVEDASAPELSGPVALADHPGSALAILVGPQWTLRRMPSRDGAWALIDLRRDAPGPDDPAGRALASRLEAITSPAPPSGSARSWMRVHPSGLESVSPSGELLAGPLAALRLIESATLTLEEPGDDSVSGRLELRFVVERAGDGPK